MHVKILRSYRGFSRYFLLAYDSEGYQYMWQSSGYRWLWLARWLGVRAARKYVSQGYPEPMRWAGKFTKPIGIERIDL